MQDFWFISILYVDVNSNNNYNMNKKITKLTFAITAIVALFASCSVDDDYNTTYLPTALVTVKPTAESFVMQLNDSVRLIPANMSKSPFGEKEVRALVNYQVEEQKTGMQRVNINWIDSIRTKMPVAMVADKDNAVYGNDPIDIVNDWVTVAEDGYLTLRIRARWGNTNKVHYINLLTGVNPENPYELLLCHNANNDIPAQMGDALIAFNLRDVMAGADTDKVKFTLRWNSFNGMQKIDFDLKAKPMDTRCELNGVGRYAKSIE